MGLISDNMRRALLNEVESARLEVATWDAERRNNVQLEGRSYFSEMALDVPTPSERRKNDE